ncbi:MAG: response regulator transcription factor [Saprospiraceae bacterium]|jgi:DNA-binding NarL/FixJ family response regulator|nr:response regulator transcription factor [Saprospiraceae bacterium]MBP6237933.1 response regulator transcription factor [Saprospiraceae bacterium]MBP6566293.1 response regulator transcription factor [Saprospiraceae bacterium]MBP9198033.1 response regulator transcription factor [Saprospiraceae bacterium]
MQKIKVAIYEDNNGLRDILASIIRESEEFELAGEFGHCIDVVQNTKAFAPEVIIMDIDMPGRTGIEGVKELKAVYPEVEVIMNTVFDDDDRIFYALKAGATGYLLKKNSLATLLTAIKDVKNGGAPISPSIARKVLQLPFASGIETNSTFNLSEREIEILKHLSKGLSYKMVANEMVISLDTVRTYVKRIYEKLRVHSITEAVHKVFIEKKD